MIEIQNYIDGGVLGKPNYKNMKAHLKQKLQQEVLILKFSPVVPVY